MQKNKFNNALLFEKMSKKANISQNIAVLLTIMLLAWVAYAQEIEQKVQELGKGPQIKKNGQSTIYFNETDAKTEIVSETTQKPIEPLPPEPLPPTPSPIPQIEIASPLEGETISRTLIVIPKFNYPEEISVASMQVLGENYSFEQGLVEKNSWIGEWDSTLAENGEFRLLVDACIETECTQKTVNFFVENKTDLK